jgi:hypothetical protein
MKKKRRPGNKDLPSLPLSKAWKGTIGLFILLYMLPGAILADQVHGSRRETVDIGKFDGSAAADGVPAGWRLQSYKGRPRLAFEKAGGHCYLRLRSAGDTAYGIKKDTRIDLKRFPFLNWTWKADRLPRGGDIRKREADDQALQVYLAFPDDGFAGLTTSPAIAYIWDNLAPRGLKVKSPQPLLQKVRYVVMRNGMDRTGQWQAEKRNIYEDYLELIAAAGRPHGPATVEGILLFINTHKTKSEAEGCIGDIFFSSE